MGPRRLAATLGAAVLLLAGCATGPKPTAQPSPTQVRPRSTATLAIVEPAPGSVLTGTKLQVRLKLTGGTIVSQTTTDITPHEGHIHLMVDGKVVSMTYGLEQEVEVLKGRHLLEAEFVAADHFPFNPRVLSSVVIASE